MRLYEEFGLSVSDDTIYRALKKLGFSHMSARPKAYKQNAEAMDAFKKTSPSVWIDAEEGCTGDFVVVKLPHPMDQCSAYEYLAEKATLDRVSRRAVRQQIEATRPTDGNPKTVAELQALLAKIDEVRPRPSAGR